MHIWLKCCTGIDPPCNHVPPARGVRTRRASVWLFPSVSPLVCREVVASGKHLERKQVQEQIMNCSNSALCGGRFEQTPVDLNTPSRLLCEFSNLEQLSLGQIICIFVVHNKGMLAFRHILASIIAQHLRFTALQFNSQQEIS